MTLFSSSVMGMELMLFSSKTFNTSLKSAFLGAVITFFYTTNEYKCFATKKKKKKEGGGAGTLSTYVHISKVK